MNQQRNCVVCTLYILFLYISVSQVIEFLLWGSKLVRFLVKIYQIPREVLYFFRIDVLSDPNFIHFISLDYAQFLLTLH